jgi:hypothetical protein
MITLLRNTESKFFEMIQGLQENPAGYYLIHFPFAGLQEQFRSEYQQRIIINIISDLFKKEEGALFVAKDADFLLLYKGSDKKLIEKVIFQLRYLLMDDALAYNKHGFENPDFASVYDLQFQWKQVFSLAEEKVKAGKRIEERQKLRSTLNRQPDDVVYPLKPYHLAHLETDLEELDVGRILREQAVCAVIPGKDVRAVFREFYLSMRHLRQLMMPNVDLTSDPYLSKYLNRMLDVKLLDVIGRRAGTYLQRPISINLNLTTLLSQDFLSFDASIKPRQRASVVIEIDAADVYANIPDYNRVRGALQALGYRVCLDKVQPGLLLHMDREKLGANLLKLEWNETSQLNEANAELLQYAIRQWGANRIILAHSDTSEAVEYGKKLGIMLYQGYHLDKILEMQSKVLG